MSWARLVATFVVYLAVISLVVVVSTPCFRSCFVLFREDKDGLWFYSRSLFLSKLTRLFFGVRHILFEIWKLFFTLWI